ncbi:hypothetical protein C8J57DRAFT_1077724, partial [Mycena rebaudengoi]
MEVEEGGDTHEEIFEEIFDSPTTERTLSQPIGDLAARFAEIVLQEAQPFPGKDVAQDEKCFLVYQISPTEHVIMDNMTYEDVEIPSEHLRDSTFTLGLWYAEKRALICGGDPNQVPREDRYVAEFGDVYGAMVMLILQAAWNWTSDIDIEVSP